jgi:hypothetical protein
VPVSAADAKTVELVLSRERVGTYARSANMANTAQALSLYSWNAQVSGAFMLPQQVCEVAVRNAVSEILGLVYGANWPWAIGFERSLPDSSRFSMRKELSSARLKARAGNTNTVIPELKFAFWVRLFTQRFDDRLWLPHLRNSFPGMPVGQSVQQCRQMIYDELDGVRGIRNRIAHHEPIFARNLAADYARMLKLVGWRCTTTATWLDEIESVSLLLGQRP